MVGGKGAWLINHNIYLGAAIYGAKDEVKNTDKNIGYGGLIAGYIFNASKAVHYNVEMLVGAGGLANSHEKNHDNHDHDSDTFSVLEPGVNLSFALTRFSDFSAGISYRFVQETDQTNISDADLSGWSFNTSIVFGKF